MKTLFYSKVLLRLAKSYASTTSPQLSVSKLLLIKGRILSEFYIRSLLSPGHKKNLKITRELEMSKRGKAAIVMGNGPSVTKLDLASVARDQKAGHLDLFCVNNFPISEIAQQLDKKYFLVLSDPLHKPDDLSQNARKLWSKIMSTPEISLIAPTTWANALEKLKIKNSRLYFNDLSLEGFSSNISPLRPRGYVTLTAYKALAFALFQGYETVYIIGIDNSMFRTVRVDSNNVLLQSSNHISGTHTYVDYPLEESHPKGIGDYFYDLSVLFLDLKTKFSGYEVLNLDLDSLVDAFPKAAFNHKYLKQNADYEKN